MNLGASTAPSVSSNVGASELGDSVAEFDWRSLSLTFLAGTLGQGGAERQLFYILRELTRLGCTPRLLCLTRGEFWEQPIRELGVPVTWVGQRSDRPGRLHTIVNVLREQPARILQSQHFYTNLYVAAAARWMGCREIGALRNDALSEITALGRLMGGLSLRVPRLLAANSRNAIQNARRLGVASHRLALLPNVVDTDQFHPHPERPPGPIRLLAVGRLVEQKRFDRLLDALAIVRDRGLDFQARVVGEGPLRSRLESQAEALGLRPPALVLDQSKAEMAEVYRDHDLLVLSSDHEGTPNVVMEALASGLAVVATPVGDVPALLVPALLDSPEVGIVTPDLTVLSLADAISALIGNLELVSTLGSAARRSAVDRFSPAALLPDNLARLYLRAIGRSTPYSVRTQAP